jgi:hypothetical protein
MTRARAKRHRRELPFRRTYSGVTLCLRVAELVGADVRSER